MGCGEHDEVQKVDRGILLWQAMQLRIYHDPNSSSPKDF